MIIYRSSLHDGSRNGYLPDSDNNDSRRTSYISCNGGSVTAIPQADTQIPVDGIEDNKDLQTEGTAPTTYSNIEDPDAIDEAVSTSRDCDITNMNSTLLYSQTWLFLVFKMIFYYLFASTGGRSRLLLNAIRDFLEMCDCFWKKFFR